MEPAVGSFAYLNAQWGDKGNPQQKVMTHMRNAGDMTTFGDPVVKSVQTIQYRDYPDGAPFPWMWFGFLVANIAWNVYSQGKDHWGTSPMPKSYLWIFDVSLALSLFFMVLDTIVTVNGTFVNYGTTEGLEANGYLRQWAAWLRENVGLNFAWAMVLTDVIEGTIVLTSWYYARKERNLTGLFALWSLCYAHSVMGWNTWGKSVGETLAMIPGVLKQLGGTSHKYQGGGPQYVIGVV